MNFGEKIMMFRKGKQMTQEQLADQLDVSRQAVSKWESGLSYPETEKLIELTRVFDCSLDYLLKDEVEVAKQSQDAQQTILEPEMKKFDWSRLTILAWGVIYATLSFIFYSFPFSYVGTQVTNTGLVIKLYGNAYYLIKQIGDGSPNIWILIGLFIMVGHVCFSIAAFFTNHAFPFKVRNKLAIAETIIWYGIFLLVLPERQYGIIFLLVLSTANMITLFTVPYLKRRGVADEPLPKKSKKRLTILLWGAGYITLLFLFFEMEIMVHPYEYTILNFYGMQKFCYNTNNTLGLIFSSSAVMFLCIHAGIGVILFLKEKKILFIIKKIFALLEFLSWIVILIRFWNTISLGFYMIIFLSILNTLALFFLKPLKMKSQAEVI